MSVITNAIRQTTSKAAARASLRLKTGQAFQGVSFGARTNCFGEAVFTTSLVGYPESMTDPSYKGQILVFTHPLIGNYGVPAQTKDEFGLLKYFESDRIQVSGIVVNDYAAEYSHWTAVESLGEWCKRHSVPAISGVDTRAIVQLLRDQGSTPAQLLAADETNNPILSSSSSNSDITFPDPNAENLVAQVSTKEPIYYRGAAGKNGDEQEANPKILLVDCGVKQNIIRCLLSRGADVLVLPHDYNFNRIADQYDGLFVSNGPGNPATCTETIKNLRTAIETFNKPIFGICMGNLLLGMAAGMNVYKLPFGNRGHNQPVLHVESGKCVITSQNHGYALDDHVMPKGWKKLFVNANDGSNEGIRHETLPIFSVQFHPEAKGGPQDTEYLFEEFMGLVQSEKAKRLARTHAAAAM